MQLGRPPKNHVKRRRYELKKELELLGNAAQSLIDKVSMVETVAEFCGLMSCAGMDPIGIVKMKGGE